MANDTGERRLSELFRAAFRLVREHASLLVGLALLIDLPMALGLGLVSGLGIGADATLPDLDGLGLGSGVSVGVGVGVAALAASVAALVLLSLWPAVIAALTAACLDLFRGGEPDFGRAFAAARARYWHLAWTLSLLVLYEIGAVLALALPVVGVIWLGRLGGALATGGTLALVLGLLLVVPALLLIGTFLQGLTQLLVVVAVAEPTTADEAIGCAFRMAWSARWRVVGLTAVLLLVAVVSSSLSELALGSLPWLGAACWGFVQALVMAFGSATWVAFYLDRSEVETSLDAGAEPVFEVAPELPPAPLF